MIPSCPAPTVLRVLRVLSFEAVCFVSSNFLLFSFELGQHQLIEIFLGQAGHKPFTLLGLRRGTGLTGAGSTLG